MRGAGSHTSSWRLRADLRRVRGGEGGGGVGECRRVGGGVCGVEARGGMTGGGWVRVTVRAAARCLPAGYCTERGGIQRVRDKM